jgi:GST-like protein
MPAEEKTMTMTAAAKKPAAKKTRRKKAAKKTARKAGRKSMRKAKTARKATRKGGRRKAARKTTARRKTARRKTARKSTRRKSARKKAAAKAGRSSGAGGAAIAAVAKRAASSSAKGQAPASKKPKAGRVPAFRPDGKPSLDLYYWPTPNGHKITIFLEEVGLPYNLIPVNIGRGDQFKPEFLEISPNNRMPALVDHMGPGGKPLSIFESGAILHYLGEKTGSFFPRDVRKRANVLEWLFWQMAGLGPMCGQAHHFRNYAPEKLPYAIERYTNEVNRLYGVMEIRLRKVPFLAGDYSIADMAAFPWVMPYKNQGQDLDDFPHLRTWFDTIKERPAVRKAIELGKELREQSEREAAKRSEAEKQEAFRLLFQQRARS